MLSLSSWSIKLLRVENWNFSRVKKIAWCKHHLLHVSFFLILTRALEHIVCLGESHLSQVNNSRRADVFPAGVANFGKAMYRSLESQPRTPEMDFFCTVPRPHFLVRALIWPGYLIRRAYSRPFWITSFQFVKVCGIHFLSGKASLVSISAAILLLRSWHIYFLLEFEFRGKSCSWVRAWRRRWHLVSPTLYIIIVYRVNLNKLPQIITKLRWSNKDNNN